jgi:CheY-like chemotaxis protein
MPGMDGLQAVRAIKNNPATATIPIMMYTSQEGELYVGQARALGAVGVLPKQIKPVEVSAVLKSLHLIDTPARRSPAVSEPAPPPESVPPRIQDVAADLNSRDWSDLHSWLQEMFLHHRQDLRADIETTVARVLREQTGGFRVDPPPRTAAPATRRSGLTTTLILVLTALAGVFFWLNLDTQGKWRAAVDQNASLMAALNSGRDVASMTTADSLRDLAAERDQASGRFADFIAALEWGVNQSAVFEPETGPFDDQRLETLRGLLERLAALGFTGTVRLDSHVGDFCYVTGAPGILVVAPDELPAERCERLGLPASEARAASARESVGFANFLGTRSRDARIRIQIVSHGNAAPAVPYPPGPQGLTAGEWNAVARQNNRVTVALLPAGA